MKKTTLLVIVLIIISIAIMTFPLVFKITTHIPGFFSTDEIYAPIWEAWRIKYSLRNNLPIRETNLIAYPFGVDIYRKQPIGYLFIFINFTLSILTTHILTYNLQIIFNLALTALFTYFLVYFVTQNVLSAFFSGITLSFCPYIFVRSWQHLGETYIWPIPLFLWFLFQLKDKDNLKIKTLFIASFILTTINFTGAYYSSIILGTFLVYLVSNWRKNKIYFRKVVSLMTIVFLILFSQLFFIFYKVTRNIHSMPAAYNIYRRPFEDLFSQSAKPLSYFLPATMHPIFGKFTEQFIGSPLYGVSFTEHTLYLGWIPLILAFIAFRKWRKSHKKLSTINYQLSTNEDFYIGFFVLLVIIGWLFSQPPWWRIGKIMIFMPSFFMYKILPMYRAYCRFGIVVMLAVAILAGFGLKFILERFSRQSGIPQNAGKTQKSKIIITTLFCGLVLFEFWNYPPFKVIDLTKYPKVYDWLKQQSADFVIAEYPLDVKGPSMGPRELYKFYQTIHHKKIINGTNEASYPYKIQQTIIFLSVDDSPKVLKWLGVKYVLVHKDLYDKTGLISVLNDFDNIKHNPGLKFIQNFDEVYVYEVIAQPKEPNIDK